MKLQIQKEIEALLNQGFGLEIVRGEDWYVYIPSDKGDHRGKGPTLQEAFDDLWRQAIRQCPSDR